MNKLTQAELKEHLHYSPDSGLFTRKTQRGGQEIGSIAGSLHIKGYICIYVNRKPYKAHRLAFLYLTGVFPEDEVDHIDGVKDNNIFSNLRVTNRNGNCQNLVRARKDNKLGLLGVSVDRITGMYIAQIQVDKKKMMLGKFDTPEEAHQAYLEAKRRLHRTCTI